MMGKRALIAFLLVFIIFVSVSLPGVADESHVRPGDGKNYLAPLINTLDRTKKDMEDSLVEALKVNYTLKEDENGNISQSIHTEHLNKSKEISVSLKKELSTVDKVLWKIKGEVESSKYLKDVFIPFYHLSSNLTKYSRYHRNLTRNLTFVVNSVNQDNLTIKSDISVEEAFNHVYFYLKEMRGLLESMEQNLNNIDGELFRLESLENSIQKNYDLLEKYEEDLEFVDRYIDRDPTLTLYGPKKGYPGSEIFLKGVFNKKGTLTSDVQILLLKENKTIGETNVTREGFFEYSYNISWEQELNSLNFSAKTKTDEIRSDDVTVDIVKYPSSILLKTEKKVYYDEKINISGEFRTKADINLSKIVMSSPKEKKININKNGGFQFTFKSKNFRWGKSKIRVNYSGNRTISPCSEDITFEVSIPTKIVFSEESKILKKYEPGELYFEGKLVNVSSQDGLRGQSLNIYLNGEYITNVTTGDNGEFGFSLPEHIKLEEGIHTLNARYKGSKKYRKTVSKDVQIEIGKQQEKQQERKFWQRPLLMSVGVILIGAFVVIYYLFAEREKERKVSTEKLSKKSDSPSRVSVPKAASSDDITKIYREFLNKLESSGIIDVTAGKTHRELEDEISSQPGLDNFTEEVKYITDIFEKVLFTDRDVEKSEIKKFNSYLSTITKEVPP